MFAEMLPRTASRMLIFRPPGLAWVGDGLLGTPSVEFARMGGLSGVISPFGPAPPPPAAVQHRDTRHLGQQQYGDQQGYRKKKKESFLSDLFDF